MPLLLSFLMQQCDDGGHFLGNVSERSREIAYCGHGFYLLRRHVLDGYWSAGKPRREVRCFVKRCGVRPDNRSTPPTVVRLHAYALERLAYRWMLARLLPLLL